MPKVPGNSTEIEADLRRALEGLRRSEAELRAKELRLRQAVEGAGLATWEWTPATGQVVRNERFAEMLGYRPDEIGDTLDFWKRSLHPEDRDLVLARLEDCAAGRSSAYEAEYRLRHRDGRWLWMLAVGRIMERGEGGQGVRICGTHLDISDQKRLEVEHAGLASLVSAIVDSTSDLIWSVEAERFRLVTFNRALREYYRENWGIDLKVGMEQEELLPEPGAEHWRKLYRRAVQEGDYSVEYETGKAGRVLEAHLSPLERDGKVVGISVFGRDVTEKRNVLDRLRRSEAFFRAVQEASPDVAAVVGRNRMYSFVSAACEGVLGHAVAEVVGTSPLKLLHPDDAPRLTRTLDRVMATEGAAERARYRIRHRDGSWRFLDTVARNKLGDPAVEGVLVNARDVTELVLLAARLQEVREEEKTRIARDLHDQLGQLLTGLKLDLLWMEERLEAMEPTPLLSALVERSVAASTLAEQTVAEVQRIATDLRPAALDRLGLAAALQQEGRRFEARARVACRVEIMELPALPASAATALYRIAQEALTNVARHAKASHVVIRLESGPGQVVLVVEDDGVGFDPAGFGQAEGLGLAGMRERATLEGGELILQRRPGGGTSVCARLPLHAPAEGKR